MSISRLLPVLLLLFSTAVAASEARHSDLLFPIGLLGEDQASLKLRVDSTAELDIISPDGLTYDIGQGTINFDILGPIFCFGLAGNDQAPGLALDVRNSNGDPVIAGMSLSSNLNYRLTNSEIAMSTPNSGACFYESSKGFGLAGIVQTGESETPIFRDRFQQVSGLTVLFDDVPQVVRVGEPVSYSIELINTGSRDLTEVAVQELYPRNNELYDVVLRQGRYSCVEVPDGDSMPDCADGHPVQIPELGFVDRPWIRGENLILPRGTSVRFDIQERPVATRIGLDENDVINSRIDLYAGAIVRDGVDSVPVHSSATATIRIAGPAESLLINDGESELSATADGSDQAVVIVRALDAFGGVPNVTIDSEIVSGNSGDIQITPSAVTNSIDGSATFFASTTVAGDFDVRFSAVIDGQSITTAPETLEFAAGPATGLRFVSQPADAIVGQALKPLSAELIDAFGNRILADSQTEIELTLGGGSDDGELTGGEATAVSNGLVTFDGLSVNRAAAGYTLTAGTTRGRGSVAPAVSDPFTIGQASTSVSITAVNPESEQQVNQPYAVTAELVDGFNPTGTIEIDNGEDSCQISATGGSCNLSSSEPGAITLTASYPGDVNNTASAPVQIPYTIIAGDPHRLTFSDQPSNGTAGQTFDELAVSVLDEWDNLVEWDNGTIIDVSMLDSEEQPVLLEGTRALSVQNGVATFDNLSTTVAGSDFVLRASAASLNGSVSAPFDVAPAQAFTLEFLSIPDILTSGLPLTPSLQVGVVDVFGNVISTDSRSITLRVGNGISTQTISTQTAVGGIASFGSAVPPNWWGRNLEFEATGSPLFRSTPIEVSVATFGFSGFDDIVAGQTSQASFEADASASSLPASTLVRYRLTLLDASDNGVSGVVLTHCADGPVCNDPELLAPTDASGQTFFGPEAGISASDAGILVGGGSSSLFEFELSPAGDYTLLVELLEVDPENSSQLDWLGQGETDVPVTD